MIQYQTRITIVEQDTQNYYIGLEFYYPDHDTSTYNRLTKNYSTYEEVEQTFRSLEDLGYLDPALYSIKAL